MSANLIDGKTIARRISDAVKTEIAARGLHPGLGVILVGDDPASHLYVRLKEKACADAGIAMEKLFFRADASAETVMRAIAELNGRADIDAILVQLPLPPQLDEDEIVRTIDPAKDADGFHPDNVALFKEGRPRIVPGLVAGINELIRSTREPLAGKRALVVANSETFYTPLAVAIADDGLLPSFAFADDPHLAKKTAGADVLVVAAGKAKLITGAMLKPGAIVIDVGTNRVDGKLAGDVDFDSANAVAGHLTPVPGGVGPMTIAMLLTNILVFAKKNRSK